jgi:hypothetical protein
MIGVDVDEVVVYTTVAEDKDAGVGMYVVVMARVVQVEVRVIVMSVFGSVDSMVDEDMVCMAAVGASISLAKLWLM